MFVAGFAEVALAINDAGQDMQSLGFERLHRLRTIQRADGCDLAVPNADVPLRNGVRRGHSPTAYYYIERLSHTR